MPEERDLACKNQFSRNKRSKIFHTVQQFKTPSSGTSRHVAKSSLNIERPETSCNRKRNDFRFQNSKNTKINFLPIRSFFWARVVYLLFSVGFSASYVSDNYYVFRFNLLRKI